MKMQSTIPISLGLEASSVPPAALERTYCTFGKVLSAKMRAVDAAESGNEVLTQTTVAPVKRPVRRQKSGLHLRRVRSPDPCSYDPQFGAMLPRTPVVVLPKREHSPRRKDVFSMEEILRLYTLELRDFDPEMIETIVPERSMGNFSSLNTRDYCTLTSKSERKSCLIRESEAASLDPYDIPSQKDAVVPRLDLQRDREFEHPIDPGRRYERAVEQRDNLRPHSGNLCNMETQKSRDFEPPKNKTLEMMKRLKTEREQFIEELHPRAKSRDVKSARPLSSFKGQMSRKGKLFPDERIEEIKEEFWPFDPLKALKKTKGRNAEMKIHTSNEVKARTDIEFWTVSGYHTRPSHKV
jgi:hypothetical protein